MSLVSVITNQEISYPCTKYPDNLKLESMKKMQKELKNAVNAPL